MPVLPLGSSPHGLWRLCRGAKLLVAVGGAGTVLLLGASTWERPRRAGVRRLFSFPGKFAIERGAWDIESDMSRNDGVPTPPPTSADLVDRWLTKRVNTTPSNATQTWLAENANISLAAMANAMIVSPFYGLDNASAYTSNNSNATSSTDYLDVVAFNRWFVGEAEESQGLMNESQRRELFLAAERPPSEPRGSPGERFKKAACAGDIACATLEAAGFGLHIQAAITDCADGIRYNQANCARDIFAVVRSSSALSACSILAAGDCGNRGNECGVILSNLVQRVGTFGEVAAQMANLCQNPTGPTPASFYTCGSQLERLAWDIGPFTGGISAATRVCTKDPDTKKPTRDYGLCVGEVISSCAYMAASGLQLRSTRWQCDYAKSGKRAGCSRVISRSLSALSLAAEKMARGAGHCGGIKTECGSDLSLMSAALFASSQEGSTVGESCNISPNICAIASLALAKTLSVVAAKALDGANSCRGSEPANIACGSDISKALAAVAYIAEDIARATDRCNRKFLSKESTWECGRSMERIGQGAQVLALSIGAAAENCGLGASREVIRPIELPWRFYV